MRLLIMGAPGAGKGTQAALIKDAYNIPHISTGDMFREAISNSTKTGLEAKSYMDKGELVPDEVTIRIVKERLSNCPNGFLLDGFPRNINQAQALNILLKELDIKLDCVLNIVVPDEILLERLTGRRTCSKCNASFHIITNKPLIDNVCDVCSGNLIQRIDDSYETIKNRLDLYYTKTKPVLDYYILQNIVNDIKGVGEILEIFKEIKNILGDF